MMFRLDLILLSEISVNQQQYYNTYFFTDLISVAINSHKKNRLIHFINLFLISELRTNYCITLTSSI